MTTLQTIKRAAWTMSALVLVALLATGCSRFDAPTASPPAEADLGLWAPNPGDQVIPGHHVPILNEGYWESVGGKGTSSVDGGSSLPPPVIMRIGPQGGVLFLGYHRLIVPRGAVSGQVTITMGYASANAVAVDCNPSPFIFNVPVTLVLSYRDTQYEDEDGAPPLSVVYMASDGSLQPLSSVVNPVNLSVSAATDHFSRYIIG
jgi:hypothetical protein